MIAQNTDTTSLEAERYYDILRGVDAELRASPLTACESGGDITWYYLPLTISEEEREKYGNPSAFLLEIYAGLQANNKTVTLDISVCLKADNLAALITTMDRLSLFIKKMELLGGQEQKTAENSTIFKWRLNDVPDDEVREVVGCLQNKLNLVDAGRT